MSNLCSSGNPSLCYFTHCFFSVEMCALSFVYDCDILVDTGTQPTQRLIVPVGKSITCAAVSAEELYVVVDQPKDQLCVYDTTDLKLKRSVSVPSLTSSAQNDLALCTRVNCLYLSDHIDKCVHRLQLPSKMSKWRVKEHPYGVSVSQNNVLVTCRQVKKILEYTEVGDFVREMSLDVASPWHCVQLSADRFLVVHGYHGDASRGLVVVDACGKVQRRSSDGGYARLNVPRHCAVADSGCVYVVDVSSQRVISASPNLQYVRDVSLGCDDLAWWPTRVSLDPTCKHLYVVDSSTQQGRVIVYDIGN